MNKQHHKVLLLTPGDADVVALAENTISETSVPTK